VIFVLVDTDDALVVGQNISGYFNIFPQLIQCVRNKFVYRMAKNGLSC